jgi:hypothetical protein
MKMFRPYSVILILLLYASMVNAQGSKSKWFTVIGGISSPWLIPQNAYGNPEFEYFPTAGYTAGVGMKYFINSEWGFEGTVLATKIGQNYKGIQAGGEAERKVKLYYLEAPLVVMKKLLLFSKPVWFSVGPDFFYLLNAKQEYQRIGGNPLPHLEFMTGGNVKERFNPVDVSLYLAASQFYTLDKNGKNRLLISLNTSIGLTDINSAAWKTPQPDGSYSGTHNFYMGIKAGLMFNTLRKDRWDSSF